MAIATGLSAVYHWHMERNAVLLNGDAVERELRERGMSLAAFCRKANLDYSHFWSCLRRGKSAGGHVLSALAREGIDLREVLVAPTAGPYATAPDTHAS